MAIRSNFARDAKYELMVYLAEQGLKDLDALIAIKPEEAAGKFKGTSSQVLDVLTQYVKSARKRIAAKGYFFPGVGPHEHTSKIATVNGLRKYLAKKGKTLASIGIVTSSRQIRPSINSVEDALTFLRGIKK